MIPRLEHTGGNMHNIDALTDLMTDLGYNPAAIAVYIEDCYRSGNAYPIGPVQRIRISRDTELFSVQMRLPCPELSQETAPEVLVTGAVPVYTKNMNENQATITSANSGTRTSNSGIIWTSTGQSFIVDYATWLKIRKALKNNETVTWPVP